MADEKETKDQRSEEEERKRESGVPGGGAGRRDEVHATGGVYPASARESAPDDAVIRQQAEWGQGERGAAGYEDHGDSELTAYYEELEKGQTGPEEEESEE